MSSTAENEIISLSQQKWDLMSAQDVDSLAPLFNDAAVFVHMSRTLSKEQELDVIKTGDIHYCDVDIKDVSVRFIGSTAFLLATIQLGAVVRGNVVSNPFVVTEVYVQENDVWTPASMSFTRQVTP